MNKHACEHKLSEAEAHVETCASCRQLIESLRPIVSSFGDWPADVLRPSEALWDRLSRRIAPEATKVANAPVTRWSEPVWEEVAPGVTCKILANDPARDRVTMYVHLDPGVEYPSHRHAGTEELHLLDGELWIEDRKLLPGDYYRAEAGSEDRRVWSETGCTCILSTSPSDSLNPP